MYCPNDFDAIVAELAKRTEAAKWTVRDAQCLINWIAGTIIAMGDVQVCEAVGVELRQLSDVMLLCRALPIADPQEAVH